MGLDADGGHGVLLGRGGIVAWRMELVGLGARLRGCCMQWGRHRKLDVLHLVGAEEFFLHFLLANSGRCRYSLDTFFVVNETKRAYFICYMITQGLEGRYK